MMTRSPRYQAALTLARSAAWVSRHVLHRSGSVIGGAVFQRLAPSGLEEIARQRRITFVTGTNGKSTTTAMIVAALRTRGTVATNAEGANTPHGLAWAVAAEPADEVVLEVDESWMPWAVLTLHPHTVVALNLTRDQLHRKPEIKPLATAWRNALSTVPRVVANAEDPTVVWAANLSPEVEYVGGVASWREDAVLCPHCGTLLTSLNGHWHCDACGLTRPEPTVEVQGREIVDHGRAIGTYDVLPGEANLINVAASVAAVRDRVPAEQALHAISTGVRDVAGRYQEITVGSRRVRLLLAKNPAGWAATLGMLRGGASAVISFSADGVDGRDTSWLYDVDFRPLRDRQVTVTGPRGTDLAVRLHLDGIEAPALPSVRAALDALPPGDVDVVATYAAFQAARRELRVA